jgi:hypothetical protein
MANGSERESDQKETTAFDLLIRADRCFMGIWSWCMCVLLRFFFCHVVCVCVVGGGCVWPVYVVGSRSRLRSSTL